MVVLEYLGVGSSKKINRFHQKIRQSCFGTISSPSEFSESLPITLFFCLLATPGNDSESDDSSTIPAFLFLFDRGVVETLTASLVPLVPDLAFNVLSFCVAFSKDAFVAIGLELSLPELLNLSFNVFRCVSKLLPKYPDFGLDAGIAVLLAIFWLTTLSTPIRGELPIPPNPLIFTKFILKSLDTGRLKW
ncbi:hypothetical protein AYI68_g757 [Smittium mucronatum]|uniref:Uncharacterized protein n=1 Tax=Smittium mucronatum TaxID=133383 RepID=A0A1R0H7E5_9FUNG|nr:hypothetical protein AYI68_g757 [Smittium mucronatum]